MRSSPTVDRVDTAFDDDRLVADAGLLLPATCPITWGCERSSTSTWIWATSRVGRTSATSS
jgi:hypothetical protein